MTRSVIGELDNTRSGRAGRIVQAFDEADVEAEITDDIELALWRKFLFIAPASGVAPNSTPRLARSFASVRRPVRRRR
jgi:2-dehydropantoate 2-reductase